MKRRRCRRDFPWREGNRHTLYRDGETFFPAMLRAIDQARERVLLEMYLVESGEVARRFIDALGAAARRGVAVHCLFDDFGSLRLKRRDRRRLVEAGVHLAFHNPLRLRRGLGNLRRDHRKLLVVDDAVAFVGGAGLTDEFLLGPRHWRETMVAVHGPCVADWAALFAANWTRWARAPLSVAPEAGPAGAESGRVQYAEGGRHLGVKWALERHIDAAEERVWLTTAYFVPPVKLRRALTRAAHRGVDVRLILPGPHTDHPAVRHAGRRFYTRLLREGVRIFEYQPRFIHAKMALCDHWAMVGSANFDRWNLRWNLENDQEVNDPAFAHALRDMFERDLADCEEITLDAWLRRPARERFLARLFGYLDLWLWGLTQMRIVWPHLRRRRRRR